MSGLFFFGDVMGGRGFFFNNLSWFFSILLFCVGGLREFGLLIFNDFLLINLSLFINFVGLFMITLDLNMRFLMSLFDLRFLMSLFDLGFIVMLFVMSFFNNWFVFFDGLRLLFVCFF
jgi:hypothetical protein